MKYFRFLLLIFISFFTFDLSVKAQPYMDASYQRYRASEKKMNAVYQQIKKEYVKNPLFLKKMEIAQNSWITSREADLEMAFPVDSDDHLQGMWGSIYPLCANDFRASYINQRTKFLSQWLRSQKKVGQDCSGSIHNFVEYKLPTR